jgi:hypothetical protein
MGDFKNPFDSENFTSGFGWDGKTVTVTGSRFVKDMFAYGSGDPVLDDNGEQAFANVWEVKGITEDSEAERAEKYSIGRRLEPSDDGESFARRDDKPATFNNKSKAAAFSAHLKESGFDVSRLVVDGQIKASALVGAQILFKGHPQRDKDGNPKQDKNGFDKVDFFPAKFVGFVEGAGATNEADTEFENRIYDLVTTFLTEAEGNTLTRIALIQAVGAALKGDPDLGKATKLVVSDKFNAAAPWKVDGTTISL